MCQFNDLMFVPRRSLNVRFYDFYRRSSAQSERASQNDVPLNYDSLFRRFLPPARSVSEDRTQDASSRCEIRESSVAGAAAM